MQKNKEPIILVLLIALLLVSILFDVFSINIINLPITDTEFNNVAMNLFGVQAAISTLGIALLALLLESIKEKRYGIRVGHFLMTNHKIFTHKSIIITEISLLFLNYIILVYRLPNAGVALYAVSLFLIIYLTNDILKLFVKKEEVYVDLQNYVAKEVTSANEDKAGQVLNDLNNHLTELAYERKLLELEENFDLYYNIYHKADSKRKILIEKHYEDIFKRISYFGTVEVNEILYRSLESMFEKANLGEHRTSFGNNLLIQIFDVLSSFPQKYFYNKDDFPHVILYKAIRDNERISPKKQDERNSSTIKYVNYIYAGLFQNTDWDKIFLQKRMIGYHDVLLADLKNNNDLDELVSYTKVLLDNKEEQVLKHVFFSKLTFIRKENNLKYDKYILSILVYCFYILIENDDLNKVKNLQPFIREVISQNKYSISEYLYEINMDQNKVYDLMEYVNFKNNNWEIFPDGSSVSSAKWLIMEKVIRNFFTNLISHRFYTITDISNTMRKLNLDVEQLYVDVISNEQDYQEQNDIFTDLFIEESVNSTDRIDLIKEAINHNYIGKNLLEAREINRELLASKMNDYEKEIVQELNTTWNINTEEKIDLDNVVSQTATISNVLPINYLDKNDSYIEELFRNFMIILIKNLMEAMDGNITKIIVYYKDENKLEKLFKELEGLSGEIDLIVGSIKDFTFYKDPLLEKYQLMVKKIENKIELERAYGSILLLKSEDFNIEVNNLSVSFESLTSEEISERTTKVGSLYEFDDYKVGRKFLFKKSELSELFSLKYKKIVWELNYKIKLKSDAKGIHYNINLSKNGEPYHK